MYLKMLFKIQMPDLKKKSQPIEFYENGGFLVHMYTRHFEDSIKWDLDHIRPILNFVDISRVLRISSDFIRENWK
jgi:hypothetical protein